MFGSKCGWPTASGADDVLLRDLELMRCTASGARRSVFQVQAWPAHSIPRLPHSLAEQEDKDEQGEEGERGQERPEGSKRKKSCTFVQN